MKSLSLKDQCNDLRAEIKRTDEKLLALRNDSEFNPISPTMAGVAIGASSLSDETRKVETLVPKRKEPQWSEMQANLQIAHRKLEDARMRVGKIIQALDGGESVYDR